MSLVTLEQARRHLKYPTSGSPPTNEHDDEITEKQAHAEALVKSYVAQRHGDDADAWAAEVAAWDVDGSPAIVPPFEVQAAVLVLLGHLWYGTRGDELSTTVPVWNLGELPPNVTALLYRLRDPALA